MINKQDIIDTLRSKVDEALVVKKFHASGGSTKHKKAKNAGEIVSLTGKSKLVRKMQGKKLKRTLKTIGSGAKKRAEFKRKLALKKRG